MKILFITHYDNLYGANNALYKLVSGLKDAGNEPIVVVPGNGPMKTKLDEIGVRNIVQPITQWQAVYVSPLRFAVKKAIRKPKIEQEVNRLYEVFKDEQIDIIHSNSSVICQGALLARKMKCKHIWHIREFSYEHFHMKYFYNNRFVSELYCEADVLVGISNAVADNYRKRYPKANVVRIYDGVDLPEKGNDNSTSVTENGSDARQEKSNINTKKFYCVGYLFEKKHQLEVIKACKELVNRGFTSFEMHFIGDGNEKYKKRLKDAIKRLNLESCVFLDGYVDDVNKCLKSADAGIIASEYEGFGLVTVEYMLNSLPIIGYNHSGTSEIVVNGQSGILFNNFEELPDAMIAIMTNEEMRCKLGKQAYIRAVNEFSEDKNIKNLIALYGAVKDGEIG